MSYAHGGGPGDFEELLSRPALTTAIRLHCEAGLALRAQEWEHIAAAFRAAAGRDSAAFTRAVAALHPSPAQRFTAVILLAKLAKQLVAMRSPKLKGLPMDERLTKVGPTPSPVLALLCGEGLSDAEVTMLGECIAPLLERLEADQVAYEQTVTDRFKELHGADGSDKWVSVGQPEYYKLQPYHHVAAEGKDRRWPDFYARPLRTLFARPVAELNLEEWVADWPAAAL